MTLTRREILRGSLAAVAGSLALATTRRGESTEIMLPALARVAVVVFG